MARVLGSLLLLVVLLAAARAEAHHEAIFGPQSSLVLSAPAYLSVQSYTRRIGSAGANESNTLVSGGVTPLRRVPLSATAILAGSRIDDGDHVRYGVEDVILGARYRLDLDRLVERFGRDGNFLLGMAAIEPPTGNVDHRALHGVWDSMYATLGSVEAGAFSGIGYGFWRHHGTDGAGDHVGDNLFLGGGLAWTPLDDAARGRLLSFQLGYSHEEYARNVLGGADVADSGGRMDVVHPTVVGGIGHHWLAFAVTSLPVHAAMRSDAQRDRWRAGVGLIYLFAGHP